MISISASKLPWKDFEWICSGRWINTRLRFGSQNDSSAFRMFVVQRDDCDFSHQIPVVLPIFRTMPYFTFRNSCKADGRQGASSCQVGFAAQHDAPPQVG
jgi:hypothetical protein